MLERMLVGYLACALWTGTEDDDIGTPLDRTYDVNDFHPDSVEAARADCEDFITAAGDDLDGIDPEQAGHDFWLTRNQHGVGFWDRGLGIRGERLTALSRPYGEVGVYVGDDNDLHIG